jgi:predicted AAA+ superfamily ATPase
MLLGARGTGKSTFIQDLMVESQGRKPLKFLHIDLLDTDQFDPLFLRPATLREQVEAEKPDWVIIDEVQKIPKLLDIVHQLMERYKKIKFGLTGSSARKLKREGANLLAGRAFGYKMHPITFLESKMDLMEVLNWGSLPKTLQYKTPQLKKKYLRTYVQTYLREEIQLEQLTRNLLGFRNFLAVTAQANGKIIRYSKIAATSGVDEKSVARFFEILSDTLVGFLLEPYDRSVRKRQSGKPKFYLFDLGVARALSNELDIPLTESTYAFGNLFEQMIILECIRWNDYLERDFTLSYLRTGNGVEVDLVVERPGRPLALVEIKSSERINAEDMKSLKSFTKDFPDAEKIVLSREKRRRLVDGNILILPWLEGLKYLFGI